MSKYLFYKSNLVFPGARMGVIYNNNNNNFIIIYYQYVCVYIYI